MFWGQRPSLALTRTACNLFKFPPLSGVTIGFPHFHRSLLGYPRDFPSGRSCSRTFDSSTSIVVFGGQASTIIFVASPHLSLDIPKTRSQSLAPKADLALPSALYPKAVGHVGCIHWCICVESTPQLGQLYPLQRVRNPPLKFGTDHTNHNDRRRSPC